MYAQARLFACCRTYQGCRPPREPFCLYLFGTYGNRAAFDTILFIVFKNTLWNFEFWNNSSRTEILRISYSNSSVCVLPGRAEKLSWQANVGACLCMAYLPKRSVLCYDTACAVRCCTMIMPAQYGAELCCTLLYCASYTVLCCIVLPILYYTVL